MNSPVAVVNAGSFCDRDGRVYHFQERVFRGLSESALDNFRQLQEKPFYTKLAESGRANVFIQLRKVTPLCGLRMVMMMPLLILTVM